MQKKKEALRLLLVCNGVANDEMISLTCLAIKQHRANSKPENLHDLCKSALPELTEQQIIFNQNGRLWKYAEC